METLTKLENDNPGKILSLNCLSWRYFYGSINNIYQFCKKDLLENETKSNYWVILLYILRQLKDQMRLQCRKQRLDYRHCTYNPCYSNYSSFAKFIIRLQIPRH